MSKKVILLVDDQEDLRKVIGLRIKSWGYDLIEAQNGQEGIDAAKTQNPDIIILDYMMPDMDGISVLAEIRKTNKTIPVVMFTAYPNKMSMLESEKLGVSSFVPKLSTYSDIQPLLKAAIHMAEKKQDKDA
ncbi:MAG TPA: response regulator [Candidatus Omnitrophota bacterium]|nr:response regulator [Candidatus Omnitrophota bacterium]HPD84256.1 response regulator [Candidatus Omnitrophota bacterium]HRZ03112.1 response regulator [Candidatus Omnitrophota bacterium]